MLESGKYASVTELAKSEKINLSYLCRVLRLTLLAPDIAEALLDGSIIAGFRSQIFFSRCPSFGPSSGPS